MRKVAIIGLDGATFEVIFHFLEQGALPNIAKFLKNGAKGILKSTCPPITAAAWLSFMTGKNPGKHGVYDFLTKVPGDYRWVPAVVNRSDTLWQILSQLGKKVVVINVPLTYPPPHVNGVLISGLGTPGDKSDFVHPLPLKEKLLSNGYVLDVDWIPYCKEGKVKEFFDALALMTQKRYETASRLLYQEEWDFFMIVFVSMDRIQHWLWQSIFSQEDKWHKIVCEYYQYLDEVLGKLFRDLQDSNIIIISDHGFGPFRYRVDLNVWLFKNNLLSFKKNPKKELALFIRKLIGDKKAKKLKKVKFLGSHSSLKLTINFKNSKAFCYNLNGIYINKYGREKYGIVNEEEYESLRSFLMENLLALKDPETGQQIVYKACRREEVYQGDKIDVLPDVIISEYDEKYILSGYGTGRKRKDSLFERPSGHSGCHTSKGIFIAQGPDLLKKELKDLQIIDIFPTILALFDIEIPKNVDGRIVRNILKKEYTPIIKCEAPEEVSSDQLLSENEAEKIMATLKGLGYL